MKPYITILFLFFCVQSKFLFAQQNFPEKIQQGNKDDVKEKELLKKRWDQALGTFQFQIINSRINPQVDISIIDEIEKKRNDTKVVYLDYKESIKIMILPKSTINGQFEKLSLFKYISSDTN